MTSLIITAFVTLLLSFIASASAVTIAAYTLYKSRNETCKQNSELEYRLKASELRLEKFLEKSLNEAAEQIVQTAQNNAFDLIQSQKARDNELGASPSDLGGFGSL